MKIREIHEKQIWETALAGISFSPFTQSWAWGEFQASLGKRVKRVFIEDGEKLLSVCQLEFEKRPFVGGYWFVPKGPVFSPKLEARDLKRGLEALKKYAEEHLRDGVFLRIEPMIQQGEFILSNPWERKKSLNPSSTRRLNLQKTEDELLQEMHQKTRYNIRVSSKKEVNVRIGGERDLPIFFELMEETAKRGQFVQRGEDYLKKTYAFLRKSGMATLRIAEYEGEGVAAQLEMWYGDTVTYLYGASSSEKRNLMAPYALHWSAIQEAREKQMRWYDLWGENPTEQNSIDYKPGWKGISRFKSKFGGEHVEFMGTYDLPIRSLIYKSLRAIGRL